MIPFSSAVTGGLTWSKIPRTRNYELKLNDETIATLERPSCRSSKFLAETQGGRWALRRGGFLGTGAEIADANSQQPIATFKSSWSSSGSLIFADGQTFHLRCKGWWRQVWTVTTEQGQPVLHLRVREKAVDLQAGVAASSIRLSLLTLFAFYWALQAEEDAAAAAVTAVIASS